MANTPPKYTKPFVSWKGRSLAMKAYMEKQGFEVTLTRDGAAICTPKQAVKKEEAKKPWWCWPWITRWIRLT